jgi:LDH2 family malate/lactate/ureidoglycolate dehydrogenase
MLQMFSTLSTAAVSARTHRRKSTSSISETPYEGMISFNLGSQPFAVTRDLAEGALRGVGYYDDEARIIADHVIDAALCNYEYSGLAKILNISESEHFKLPRRPMELLRETDVSPTFDGGNNVGMLALFHAAEATIKKAAAHGIALISVTDAWMSGRSA